jgi:hypothetical protein
VSGRRGIVDTPYPCSCRRRGGCVTLARILALFAPIVYCRRIGVIDNEQRNPFCPYAPCAAWRSFLRARKSGTFINSVVLRSSVEVGECTEFARSVNSRTKCPPRPRHRRANGMRSWPLRDGVPTRSAPACDASSGVSTILSVERGWLASGALALGG